MPTRLLKACLLSAALCAAGARFAVAGCPQAYDPEFLGVWGTSREVWAEACGRGQTPLLILIRAQKEFVDACRQRAAERPFRPALTPETISAYCAQGLPGEKRLIASEGAGNGFLLQAPGKTPLKKLKSTGTLSKAGAKGFSRGFLDGVFSGSGIKFGGDAVAGIPDAGGLGRSLPLQTLPPRLNPAVPPPVSQGRSKVWDPGRIPQKDLDRYIRIDPGYPWPKYAQSVDRSQGLESGSPGSFSVRATKEGRFLNSTLARLQDSLEGRRILHRAIVEAKFAKKPLTFIATDFPGSQIVVNDGIESVSGVRGTAVATTMTYRFNKLFSGLKEKDLAAEILAANMGHELNHIVWGKRTARTLAQHKTALDWDLVNEESARMKGYLISAELNSGRPTSYTQETSSILKGKDDYFEQMKIWNPYYAARLTRADMADPIAAFEKTRKRLEAQRLQEKEQLAKWVPERLREIAHLTQDHSLGLKLREITAYVQSRKEKLPHDIKETSESIEAVSKRLALLRSDKGPEIINALRGAARDPAYRVLDDSVDEDFRRLDVLVQNSPLPAATGTPGQIRWPEYYKLVAKDKKENPGHWR